MARWEIWISSRVHPPVRRCGKRRGAITWVDLITLGILVTLLAALLGPSLLSCSEAARRARCTDNLKQIGSGIHGCAMACKNFPPGTVCNDKPVGPSQYDVWGEAAKRRPESRGTSVLVSILPFMKAIDVPFRERWDRVRGVAANAGTADAPGPATADVPRFYCPSRRRALRPEDRSLMLEPWWPGGGTDYGGCAGRHAAFNSDNYDYYESGGRDSHVSRAPQFVPVNAWDTRASSTATTMTGIFGYVNHATSFAEVRDGTSNTIMTGELQRLTDNRPTSKDGWAIGGPATLFTTGIMIGPDATGAGFCEVDQNGMLMSNSFYGSPGSEHPGGANFGIADGSTRFVSTSTDPGIFALLGSMADGMGW